MSMQQLASPADMSSLIKDIRQDAREIRQDAKAERDELESKLKAEYKVEMQQQKMEHKAELDKMEAVLGRDLVCSSAAYGATAKLAQLVGVSGALTSDAGFARQARRKFV